jgi:hypothetical protein
MAGLTDLIRTDFAAAAVQGQTQTPPRGVRDGV